MVSHYHLKICLVILACLVAIETYHFVRQFISNDGLKFQFLSNNGLALIDTKILKPFCNCSSFESESILIERFLPKTPIEEDILVFNKILEKIIDNQTSVLSKTYLFNLTVTEAKKFTKTCDLYNVLRRGLNQKIISYSLYGKNPKYSQNLEGIVEIIREKYKGYTARVHYDSSVNETIRCHLECEYPDVIDFCNMNRFSTDLNQIFDRPDKLISMEYIHKMKWRFLPVGDSFVDVFMSRDTDSFFTDREVDAVNAWLNTNMSGHIMRGNLRLV